LKTIPSTQSAFPIIKRTAKIRTPCPLIKRVCFFNEVETDIKDWLFELQDKNKLNITLKAFRAIEQQMQIGADVREVVAQVLREIRNDFGNVKDEMDKSVDEHLKGILEQAKTSKEETEKFIKQNTEEQVSHLIEKVELLLKQGKSIEEIQKELKKDTETFVKDLITNQMGLVVEKIDTLLKQEKSIEQIQKELKEDTQKFVKEIVEGQVKTLVEKVELLLNQGKTIDEISQNLKEATGGLDTILQSLKIPSVKGEKGEVELLSMINEAFLLNKNVSIEPLGGPNATDIIVKFLLKDSEIGRVLIENKARDDWKNDFLEQTKRDMERYGIATSILSVLKLPRGAKVKGYMIDDTLGLVIITTPDMAVSTLAMFYEMYLQNYRLGKQTISLQTLMDNKDILYYIKDNLECLNDCKKINDCIDKSQRDIHNHVSTIMKRLQSNNEKIALILSKHGMSMEDSSAS